MEYKIKRGTANKPALRRRNENAAYEFVKGILHGQNNFKSYLRSRGQNYTLKNAGVLKGFAILSAKRPNGTVQLDLIGTTAEKGKGYGSALMKRIENNAAKNGAHLIIIHDPVENARGFYRARGAMSYSKTNSNNTSVMLLPTSILGKRSRSPSPTSRRQRTPNRQRSPSHPSPKRSSSSPKSSVRRSARTRTPRR